MKKTILSLTTIAIVAVMSACKKDYTCECTTTPGNSIDKYTIKSVTKAQAKANCVSTSYDNNGTKIETNCSLK